MQQRLRDRIAIGDISSAIAARLRGRRLMHAALERIGLPEGRIPLAHATTFLASAPKSNASYLALGRASAAVKQQGALPVPMHLRNAPTPFMKGEGYGGGGLGLRGANKESAKAIDGLMAGDAEELQALGYNGADDAPAEPEPDDAPA